MTSDAKGPHGSPGHVSGSGIKQRSATPHGRPLLHRDRFIEEFKRRNLARVTILYLIACWVILEPTHVVFHMLEVPAWANRLVIVLMVIGFPLVLLFSWVYEITPEGLKPTAEVDPAKSITKATGRRLDRAIIVVLSVALIYFVADKFWLSKRLPAAPSEEVSAKAAATPSAATSAQPVAANDKSIAVLPFVDMSEKKDQEYFSDGLSEELIARLAHSQDLRVIARTSCFFFKGKQATIGEIAKTLGVSHVLEGSVRKSGNMLRVTAQLIRASDGSHLWSETYDRNLSEIFKVQDDIAGMVAQALNVALHSGKTLGAEVKLPSKEAYNLVLQGNYFSNRKTETDSKKALESYTEATKVDPDYALAWAKIAEETDQDTSEGLAKSLGASQRALRIDPNSAYAHYVLGRTLLYWVWDWSGAKAELERAVELDHDLLLAHVEYEYLTKGMFGQFDEKIGYLRQVVSNDPLGTSSIGHLAATLVLADRLNEAAATYEKIFQLNPAVEDYYAKYARVLLLMGRSSEALAAAEKETDAKGKLWALALVNWDLSHRAESDAALDIFKKKYASADPASIAQVYAYRGDVDAAFEWLERAYRQKRQWKMALITVDPLFRNLHSDPRFKAMLVRLKLDDWRRKVSAS